MRILITGTLGFIGSNLKKFLEVNNIIFEINEDLFDNDKWCDFLNDRIYIIKPDAIFHVGACSDTLEQDVNYMMTRNFESTKILVDYSKKYGVPIVYSSSAAGYGVNNEYPSNLYGWSKYIAEKYVISNGGIALRYFNVYGPGEENKGKMASVAYQMFLKNIKGEEIKLFPGKPTRDFVYVDDVVSANVFALQNYIRLKGNYYDVGSGESKSFEEMMDIFDINYTYHSDKMVPNGYQTYTCSDKLKWMNGWKPNFNLYNGLTEYKKYLTNNI